MDKQIKQRWIDALRSGNYKQGKFWLRRGDKCESSFCCLGVLCDIYNQDTGNNWSFPEDPEYIDDGEEPSACEAFGFLGEEKVLPTDVAEWAGFVVASDGYSIGDYFEGKVRIKACNLVDKTVHTLADLNDSGKTFEDIAEVIEQQF